MMGQHQLFTVGNMARLVRKRKRHELGERGGPRPYPKLYRIIFMILPSAKTTRRRQKY